jgi:hypothetical protein
VGSKQDLMTALLGVFATFTALEVAVVAYFLGVIFKGTFGRSAMANTKPMLMSKKDKESESIRRMLTRTTKVAYGSGAAAVAFVVLVNGLGLLFSLLWLRADAGRSVGGWSWAFTWAVNLSVIEAVLLTLGIVYVLVSVTAIIISWQVR